MSLLCTFWSFYSATSVPHESHAMGFTTCSLVPSGPLKARRRGFWSGLTWALRTSTSRWTIFLVAKLCQTSTRLSQPAAPPTPTAAATSCAMPRSCEANESTFDLCNFQRFARCYEKYGFLLQILSWSFFLMLGKSCGVSNNWETRIQNTEQITPKILHAFLFFCFAGMGVTSCNRWNENWKQSGWNVAHF